MPVRIAVDQHCFKRNAIKYDVAGKPIELVYFSKFGEVFADIEDVQVGDKALVMYLESPTVADGVVSEIRPDDTERPWAGGMVYVTTDLTTCRDSD